MHLDMSDHQEERTNGLSQLSSFSRRPGPAIQPFVDSSRRDRVNRKGFVPQISRLAVPYQGKLDWRKSSRRYLFMQREAAEKFAGQPLNSETLTSLLYKPRFRFNLLRTFKPTDFNPVPRVTAALLRIEKRSPPLIRAEQSSLYKDFITYGFSRNQVSLKKDYEQVFGHVQFTRLAEDLSFSNRAKLTDITFAQWLGVFDYFTTRVSEERKRKVVGALKQLQQEQQGLNKSHRNRGPGAHFR